MLTSFIRKWPRWAKVLLTIFGGASVVYRAMLFVDDCIASKEEKNVKALVIAILGAVIWPFTLVLLIVDLIAVAKGGEITWLVDTPAEAPAPAAEEPAPAAEPEKVEAEVVE